MRVKILLIRLGRGALKLLYAAGPAMSACWIPIPPPYIPDGPIISHPALDPAARSPSHCRLTGPAPLHPERLMPDAVPTPEESRLFAELTRTDSWVARIRRAKSR